MAIEVQEGYKLPTGGSCDYCNSDLEPGLYLALMGYKLKLVIPPDMLMDASKPNIMILEDPFVPCPICLDKLGITEDNKLIDIEKLISLHTEVAVYFHGKYFPDSPPLPMPIVEVL
jgi:hypothetical protein